MTTEKGRTAFAEIAEAEWEMEPLFKASSHGAADEQGDGVKKAPYNGVTSKTVCTMSDTTQATVDETTGREGSQVRTRDRPAETDDDTRKKRADRGEVKFADRSDVIERYSDVRKQAGGGEMTARLRQSENGSTCISVGDGPRQHPSSQEVPRSLTSDNIKVSVTTEVPGDVMDDDTKLIRRLSSGDRPYWLLQDGTATLYVPTPSEEEKRESFLIGRANRKLDGTVVRRIRLTEVAPTNGSLVGDEEQWKIPLEVFTSKRQGSHIKLFKSKRVRSYYKAQDEMINAFEDISRKANDELLDTMDLKKQRSLASFFSKLTLAINFSLMVAKLVASVLSGSISIISSLVDSVVDLLSGLIMWWATRAVRTRNIYDYPQGRTKLEPVAIIILSVVMALASLQLIKESIERVVDLANYSAEPPTMGIATFVIAGSTVVIKFVLWVVCRRANSPIVQALSMDHRNDVMSNTVAIVCGYLGSTEFQKDFSLRGFVFADPGGAILISMYIVFNWWQTGSEQIKMLTGHTARPDFLSKLTWTAMNHDRNIKHIDTVRAFHFGNDFLVELDIVLPEDMSLRVAHDIGESLQQKLENIPEVERAFVHLDYEYEHNPNIEHKVV